MIEKSIALLDRCKCDICQNEIKRMKKEEEIRTSKCQKCKTACESTYIYTKKGEEK